MKLSLNNMLITDKVKKSFIQLISYYYPLTKEELRNYGSLLSWRGISENRNIIWTESLFFDHLNQLNAFHFYYYADLPWTKDLIDKLIAFKHAKWKHLMSNQSLLEQPDLFAYALPHWNEEDDWKFPERRFTRKVIFGEETPLEYEQIIQNQEGFNWKQWSGVDTFFWREEFIAEHAEKWDWNLLSRNHSVPWSEAFIARFLDKWNWSILSENPSLPWSTALIEEFKDHIDWSSLCIYIPMSYELVKHFDQYWDWSHLNGMLSTNAQKYGDYTLYFYQTYQFPTFQEGDLNRIMEEYSKEIIWFEYYEEYMQPPRFEGAITLPFKWDLAFFNTLKDEIDVQYKKTFISYESEEGLQSRYKDKHWTYLLNPTYLDKELFESFIVLENKKGKKCVSWQAISINSPLAADGDFINRHFSKLTTSHLVKNESFDWNKHYEKIKNELTKNDWEFILRNKILDIPLIEKYRGQLDWNGLAHNPHLSLSTIEHFSQDWSDINWYWLSTLPICTPELVNKKYPWRWDGLLRYGAGLKEHFDRDLLHLFLEEVSNTRND